MRQKNLKKSGTSCEFPLAGYTDTSRSGNRGVKAMTTGREPSGMKK
jgi:hypothetical protein